MLTLNNANIANHANLTSRGHVASGGHGVAHLEAEDDGPDEAQREALVAVDDVVGAHVLQVDALLLEELQRLVHVLQAVDAHAALGGLRLTGGHMSLLI